jgi:tRNA_anti-like
MIKKILIGLVIAGAIGGTYGYYEWNRKPESMTTRTADVTVSAQDLATQYDDAKHLGKIVQVNGTIQDVVDEGQKSSLVLKTDDPMTNIVCELDSTENSDEIPMGINIVLRGQCDGKLTDVQLSRCVVVK